MIPVVTLFVVGVEAAVTMLCCTVNLCAIHIAGDLD